MDDFFSKYGWLIVVAIIIIIAIAMASPVGGAIKANVLSFVSDFAGRSATFTSNFITDLPSGL